MKIQQAQKYLQEQGIDGWLLYVFGNTNELALHFLDIPKDAHLTRRMFYWIPQKGEPVKVVHLVEFHFLDHMPGEKVKYFSAEQLNTALEKCVKGKVAMEYSPMNGIPYISKVDGGTIDLIRSLGVEVVSSAGFLQNFTCLLTDQQWKSHQHAAKVLDDAVHGAWQFIRDSLTGGKRITEYDVQQFIMEAMKKGGCITDSPAICAVNGNSADPHYAPTKVKHSEIKKGDFVLTDLWCKQEAEGSVFADITRVAVAAEAPTEKQTEVFSIVRKAQKAATDLITEKKEVTGYEADAICRKVIEDAGYGEYFTHRTGHNIYEDVHGSGAQLDSVETLDDRQLIPQTLFSVEPGIYLPGEFGVRLEYDVFIHPDGKVEVTVPPQEEIEALGC